MKSHFCVKSPFIFIFVGLMVPASAWSDAEDRDVYKRKIQFLESRYKDYFKHNKKNEQFDETLKEGLPKFKEEELKRREAWEAARAAYQKKDKTDPFDNPELEQAWIKKQEAKIQKQDQIRENYVNQQKRLREIEEGARSVPQEAEVGLEVIHRKDKPLSE